MSVTSRRAATPLVIAVALMAAVVGCASEVPADAEPSVEPLPPGDALPPSVDSMLYGSAQSCREDAECPGRVCYFGSCMGLLLVDQRWMQERIARRLAEGAEDRARLRQRLVAQLVRVATRDGTDLGYRARALVGLEALGAMGPLREILAEADDERLEAAAALALARGGDSAGIPMTRALTEHEDTAVAMEALRALGASGHADALEPLLRTLNPALDGMLLRAAVDALGELGDPRTIRPLTTFLEDAPGYLRYRVAGVLRDLTESPRGLDPDAWEAWILEHDPPRAPEVPIRAWSPEGELGLPTP